MLSKAKDKTSEIEFQIGRAEELAFPRGFLDLVFSVDVIHHVQGRRDHYREAQQVLRTGGKICTVTDSERIIRNRRPLAYYFPETVEADQLTVSHCLKDPPGGALPDTFLEILDYHRTDLVGLPLLVLLSYHSSFSDSEEVP